MHHHLNQFSRHPCKANFLARDTRQSCLLDGIAKLIKFKATVLVRIKLDAGIAELLSQQVPILGQPFCLKGSKLCLRRLKSVLVRLIPQFLSSIDVLAKSNIFITFHHLNNFSRHPCKVGFLARDRIQSCLLDSITKPREFKAAIAVCIKFNAGITELFGQQIASPMHPLFLKGSLFFSQVKLCLRHLERILVRLIPQLLNCIYVLAVCNVFIMLHHLNQLSGQPCKANFFAWDKRQSCLVESITKLIKFKDAIAAHVKFNAGIAELLGQQALSPAQLACLKGVKLCLCRLKRILVRFIPQLLSCIYVLTVCNIFIVFHHLDQFSRHPCKVVFLPRDTRQSYLLDGVAKLIKLNAAIAVRIKFNTGIAELLRQQVPSPMRPFCLKSSFCTSLFLFLLVFSF